jgi:hypothetical protein
MVFKTMGLIFMNLNWELYLRNIRKVIETWKPFQNSLEDGRKSRKRKPFEVTEGRTFRTHFDL